MNRAAAILWRMKHAIRNRIGPPPPSFSSFSTALTEEMARTIRADRQDFLRKRRQPNPQVDSLPADL